MLQGIIIGHLGADAECKSANGREFCTVRVANTNKWTDDAGVAHEDTTWVDCVMSGKPNVLPYLKKGQQVYISGSLSVRVYSSKKDRCMKAGITINVRSIELLGGKADDVPSILYDAEGKEVRVSKWYFADSCKRGFESEEYLPLMSRNNEKYVANRDGWVMPYKEPEEA